MKDIRVKCLVCKQVIDTTKQQFSLVANKGVVHDGECMRFYENMQMNESNDILQEVQLLA